MKKWFGIIAVIAAASSVQASSLYEPFNYTANEGNALNGSVDSSEVPAHPWVEVTTNLGPTIGSPTAPVGTNPISYSGLADEQGTFAYTSKSASGTSDRIDLNASYAPGSTIYYSMLVEVPTSAAAPAVGQGSFLAGLQWLTTENTASSSYSSTTTAGALSIDYPGTNDSHGNPEYELGIGFRDTATAGAAARVFNTTPMLEGQTYLVVVKYTDGPNNNDDSASLYINPASSTFGQADPGLTPVATSTNSGASLDYGTINGTTPGSAWTATSYLGNLASFQLRSNASEAGNIDLDDVRVDTSWAGVTAVEWQANGSGGSDWGSAANWTSNVVPSATGADVTFGTNSSIYNVTLSSPQTVGTLRFNGTNSYTIGGTATLTLAENGGGTNPITGAAGFSPASVQVTAGNHTISAPVMLASTTEFSAVSGASISLSGPVTAASGIALIANGGGNTSIQPASATALQGLSGITVSGGSKLTLSASHAAITTTAFSIDATSTLDLTNNDLIVDYAPNASNPTGTDTTTGPAVVAAVQSAYSAGQWNGVGITSSQASLTGGKTLAVVDNESLVTPLTSVDGVTLDASSVVVKYTWYGDLDLDGTVSNSDLATITANAGMTNVGWSGGDLNYDGKVNADDVSLFELGAAESNGANINSVPEPGAMMALSALAYFAGRSRRAVSR
ncbi:MAG TPA: dockerin type I repeat-containing protein [Tepidisphaeraceae bacterium]|jgi:hypothetical protein